MDRDIRLYRREINMQKADVLTACYDFDNKKDYNDLMIKSYLSKPVIFDDIKKSKNTFKKFIRKIINKLKRHY